jgi:radical SAM superfamily enzyme YgiQ (UPF0313 family)
MEPKNAIPYDNSTFRHYSRSLAANYPSNKRLLLVQIPQVILDAFNRDIALDRGYYAYPPTGLQCLYDAIKHRDLEIEILDLNFELLKRIHEKPGFEPDHWPEILEERLQGFRPSLVGVSCLFDQGIMPMLKTLELVRQQGEAITIGGGVIATYESENLIDRDLCHFVVRGEGENKFNFPLDHITDQDLGTPPTPGIRFQIDGTVHETQAPPDVVEFKGNLIDSYRQVPIQEYYKYGSLNPYSRRDHTARAPFAAIQFNRGCRAECTFCAVRDFMGKGVRSRPFDQSLEEMAFLIETHGVKHFELLDDDPTFFRTEFKRWLRAIIERKWDIRWSANNGIIAASLDEETIQLMNESGCIGFKVGIETGNPDMLRKIKKPATHGKFLRFSKMMKPYPQMFVGGNFIVGLPEEPFTMMMDSFKFMLDVNLDWSAITVCQIIRGASAFADSGEYFEEQMQSDGEKVANFIPTRKTAQGHVEHKDSVHRGLNVFKIDPDSIPNAEQVKEVWFTFNILSNYVFNPNLKRDGDPQKFISWVETVRRAWTTNGYMSLFLSLAKVLVGDLEEARNLRKTTIRNIADYYWQERFEAFNLDQIIDADPQTPEAVFQILDQVGDSLRPAFADWLCVGYGDVPENARNQMHA